MTANFGQKSEYADVLARVRDWAQSYGELFDIWRPRYDLLRETPGSVSSPSQMATLYMTQVLRAVNQLVDEGVLVKTGERSDARYGTPEVRARIAAARERAEAARASRQELYDQQAIRFAELGYEVTISPNDGSVTFSSGDSVRLLARLGRS